MGFIGVFICFHYPEVERGGESSIVTNPPGEIERRGDSGERGDSGVEMGGESSIVTNPPGGIERGEFSIFTILHWAPGVERR